MTVIDEALTTIEVEAEGSQKLEDGRPPMRNRRRADSGHWTDFALCKGMTEVFFGPAAERPETRAKREELANSYCRLCPVASICKAMGRQNNEHGFWGGENDEERAEAGFAPTSPSRRSVIAAKERFDSANPSAA